jgi:hypothetical protein
VAHLVESLLVNRRTSESSQVRIRGMSHVKGQKLGVANTKAKCTGAQVRLPVWTRNCDRPSLTRGPGSLRLPCDVK